MGKHLAKQTNKNQNKPLSAHSLKTTKTSLFIGATAISRRSPCLFFVIPSGFETVLRNQFIY